jgi:hypothetical protein
VVQAAEVFLAHGRGDLNLDADYLALAAFQHGVDLYVIFRAVVE